MLRRPSFLLLVAVLAVALSGCAEEEYPAWLYAAQHAGPGALPSSSDASASEAGAPDASLPDSSATAPPLGPAFCQQANAQSYPSRLIAMGGTSGDAGAVEAAPVTGTTYFVADLFQQFTSNCGRCHGPVQAFGTPPFAIISAQDFPMAMTQDILRHVLSNKDPCTEANAADPDDPMPPCGPSGKPYSQRDPTDTVRQFAELVQTWIGDGKPASFMVANAQVQSAASFAVTTPIPSATIGNAMTNIGNCIPTKGLIAVEQAKSAALDALFAGAQAIPPGPGVSPAQTIGLPEHLRDTDLFTLDSATLAAYGVIAYAPGYPLWSDNAAKLRHIRVPRGTSVTFDKTTQSFSIPPNTRFYKTFMKEVVDTDGSIRYRKIETRLIVSRPNQTSPDGTVNYLALFGSYKWTEDESDAVLVQTPLNSGVPFADTLFQYNTDEQLAADILKSGPAAPEEALIEGRAARHYAIPSSDRCIQCHEGSESHSFVLGFLPLQINRRPAGQGGVIEPTGPDELTQLQRFIDYGLITGMSSPSDVLPLERSEGSRAPRNDYELVAQGYMLGNCTHCHNPDGDPSMDNPVLTDILNFLPGPNGGIFQFPLERTSPRIFRGAGGQAPIPYITPSLMDLPRADVGGIAQPDPFKLAYGSDYVLKAMYAPWRSLIYRNVDNPFAYTDDLALYPHMPMNTPGYDPRAKQLLSDWMVSIPAVRKSPNVPEYAFLSVSVNSGIGAAPFGGSAVDTNTQPYVEVLPTDPRYQDAANDAQQRLAILHSGSNPNLPTGADTTIYSRYSDPGQTSDVLDPQVVADPVCHPVPVPNGSDTLNSDPVPAHPHWTVTDSTQPFGDWSPRRADWASALVEQTPPSIVSTCGQSSAGVEAAQKDEATAVTLLQQITLDPAREYLTTPVPFGLWQQKAGCRLSSQPTVGSFTGAQRPLWMDQVQGLSPDAPVYQQSPGQAVFKMICINCHGPKADADGRLAKNLAIMTGGLAQVANFRDGLFGPVGASAETSDIHRVFGSAGLPANAPSSWTGVTDDDRASRYMAWMALGGTSVKIPAGILQIVAVTQVLDQHRGLFGSPVSGNMLSSAKGLCTALLGAQGYEDTDFIPANPTHYSRTLIHSNGDAELWLHLCSLNNPSPVHVIGLSADRLTVDVPFGPSGGFISDTGANALLPPAIYPPGTPVGNDRGGVDPTLGPDNLWPWCAYPTSAGVSVPSNLPACPPGLADSASQILSPDDADTWALRGAINAGLGVFLYVNSLETQDPPPDYDECELLP